MKNKLITDVVNCVIDKYIEAYYPEVETVEYSSTG